jgi:hypothetical protein
MEEYVESMSCLRVLILRRTVSTMFGKQYRFNLARCQPPNYWVIEKVHKYQQKVRNDLGQLVTVTKERLLEMFVIVDRKVMKCSTLYDLANVRIVRPALPNGAGN